MASWLDEFPVSEPTSNAAGGESSWLDEFPLSESSTPAVQSSGVSSFSNMPPAQVGTHVDAMSGRETPLMQSGYAPIRGFDENQQALESVAAEPQRKQREFYNAMMEEAYNRRADNPSVKEKAGKKPFEQNPGRYGKRTDEEYRDYADAVAKRIGVTSNPQFVQSLKSTLDAFDLLDEDRLGADITPKEMRPAVLEALQYGANKDISRKERPGVGTKTLADTMGTIVKISHAVDRLNPMKSQDQWEYEGQLNKILADPQRFENPEDGFLAQNLKGAVSSLPKLGMAAALGGAAGVATIFGTPTAFDVEQLVRERGGSRLAAIGSGLAAGALETAIFSKLPGKFFEQFGGKPMIEKTFEDTVKRYAFDSLKTGGKMTAAGLQAKLIEEGGTRLGGGRGKPLFESTPENKSLWRETILSLPDTAFQAMLFHSPELIRGIASLPENPSRKAFEEAGGPKLTPSKDRAAMVQAAQELIAQEFKEQRQQPQSLEEMKAELESIRLAAAGTPERKGPNGMVIPAEPNRFYTNKERARVRYLEQTIANAESAIAETGIEITDSKPQPKGVSDGLQTETEAQGETRRTEGLLSETEQAGVTPPQVPPELPKTEAKAGTNPSVPEESVIQPPAPYLNPEIVSIKNRIVEARRAKDGRPQIESDLIGEGFDEKMLDDAAVILSNDPMAGHDLIARINKNPKMAIRGVDQAVLQIHNLQLLSRQSAAMDSQIAAYDAGDADALEAATIKVNQIRQQVDEADLAYRRAGTSASYSMLARKTELNADGTPAGLERRMRSANGGAPVTEAQQIEIIKLANELKAAQEELKAYREKQAQADEESRDKELDATHEKLVSESEVKRQATINERTRKLLKTAKEHGLDPDELEAKAKERAKVEANEVEEYNRNYRALQQETGLTPKVISEIENAGTQERTGADRGEKPTDILEYNGLDTKAAELTRAFSVLDLRDDPQKIVDVLKGGPKKVPEWHEKLGEVAAEMAKEQGSAWEPEEVGDGGFLWGDAEETPAEKGTQKPIRKRAETRKKLDDAWSEFKTAVKNTIKGTLPTSTGVPIEAINAGLKVIKAAAEHGLTSFTAFMKEARKALGDAVDELRPLFSEAWKQSREKGEIPGREVEIEDKSDIGRLARQLHREVVELGITDREEAVDAVHDELKQFVPNITRRQTMDAMSGYGDYRELSKDEISVRMRGHKGELQQIAKLQDMEAGKAPLKSGVARREGTPEERRLQKLVNEKKKEGNYVVTDPERQLKTAQGSAETYLRNRIADLKKEIETKQKIVKDRKPLRTSKKIEALKEELAQVTKLHEEIFPSERTLKARERAFDAAQMAEWDTEGGAGNNKPKKPLTDAQRLENYKQRRLKQYADLEARLRELKKTGEIPAKKAKRELELDKEAERLNRKVDASWKQVEEMEAMIRISHATRIEKLGSLATSLIQSNVLSSPTVVVHIAGAVAWKLPGILKDEIARLVLSKVVPGFKELSPLEGRSDIPAYLRGLLNIKQTAKNSMDQMLSHGTESHRLYGERHDPPAWTVAANDASPRTKKALRLAGAIVEAPGRSHGAMKEAVRSPAEALALSKLMADAKAHGEDVNNPEVSKRIHQAAMEWSSRQILMQKNEGASTLRSLAYAKIDPKTGHKTAAGVAKEVLGVGVLPVVRVGMNWAAELIERAVGGLHGTAKFAMHKMILGDLEKLPPEAKEAIARKMVYGLSSLPVWALLGWYGYNNFGGFYRGRSSLKKDEEEGKLGPGEMKLGDTVISHHITHSPEVGVGQMFATLHKFLDEVDKNGDDKHSFADAMVLTGAGVMDTTPLSSEARTFSQITSPDTALTSVGRLMQTMLVPAWLRFLAKQHDSQKRDESGLTGPSMGSVPLLRESLPVKDAKEEPLFKKPIRRSKKDASKLFK